MAEKPFILNTSPTRLIIDPNVITPRRVDILAENLAKVNLKHSLFTKYPMLEDETNDQWNERVLPLMMEANKKKEDEDNDKYLLRIFKPNMERKEVMFDTICAIADSFDKAGAVTKDNYMDIPTHELKSFTFGILKHCDLDASGLE